MSSRRDLPTHTTGAHRAGPARRSKRHERPEAATAWPGAGTAAGAGTAVREEGAGREGRPERSAVWPEPVQWPRVAGRSGDPGGDTQDPGQLRDAGGPDPQEAGAREFAYGSAGRDSRAGRADGADRAGRPADAFLPDDPSGAYPAVAGAYPVAGRVPDADAAARAERAARLGWPPPPPARSRAARPGRTAAAGPASPAEPRTHPYTDPHRYTDPQAEEGPHAGTGPGTDGKSAGSAEQTDVLRRYEPYLDGLFTYCLSVMCEHDAATTALGEALVLAGRQHDRGRAPAERALHRPWLYSLARWACLRRLAERALRDGGRDTMPATAPHLADAARARRRRELAALAWPEAAGTTPEQREALELAVRHGLPAHEVAAVLSQSPEAAGALLSHAACEVERTRAALAVVESGGCPAVARLAGDDHLLFGTALRRELVRHVDECPECRRAAERAMAGVSWPGTAPAGPEVLTVLEAPRPAVQAALLAVRRARCQHSPRFDRAGFPVEAKDRSARREKLRSRAVTTTVVATVVAAPILALWAAYRGAPLTGESDGASVSTSERDQASGLGKGPYENAAQDTPGGAGQHGARDGGRSPGASDAGGGRHGKGAGQGRDHGDSAGGRHAGDRKPGRHGGGAGPSHPGSPGHGAGTGRLAVDARSVNGATVITLHASGGSPVRWSASAEGSWLRMSRSSGVLRPGESTTVRVTVDRGREPSGAWSAQVRIAPAGAVVTIEGHGAESPPSGEDPGKPSPSDPSDPPSSQDPSPSDPPSGS